MFSLCFLPPKPIKSPKPIKAPVNLPEDILTAEILSRLPLKSLARCLAVCKLWSSLICNSHIIQSKLNYSISQNPRDEYLLCYIKSRFRPVLWILSRTNLSETLVDQVPCPMSYLPHIRLLGSINGLVCMVTLSYDKHFILWNPAIHVSMKVSLPILVNVPLIGFGWDSVNNDYKLVVKHKKFPRLNLVYSCKTKSWSTSNSQVLSVEFPSLTDDRRCWAPDVIVKGIPYWSSGTIIFRFEVRYDQFTCLRVFTARQCYSLVSMNDCLARIDYGPGEATDVDVYGYDDDRRFWKKMYTISINISKTPYTLSHITCFQCDDEIVFFDKNIMYVPHLNVIKVLGRCYDDRTYGTCSFSYTPSLVALKGMKPLRCRGSRPGIISRLCGR